MSSSAASTTSRRWAAVGKRFVSDKGMWLAAAFLLAMVIGSIVVLFVDADPNAVDVANMLAPPSAEHWLGTDELGRDYFLRVWHGAGITLLVGVLAMFASMLIGTAAGVAAGYFGGAVDAVIMRIVDVFCSIPWIIMVTVVSLIFARGLVSIIIVIGIFSWMEIARIVRAETLSAKNRDYVAYAQLVGVSKLWIILKHVIPTILPVIITAATAAIAAAIMVESSMSFLGIGVQAPMASWGSLLQTAQGNLSKAPLMAVVPGLLIVLTILSFNKLGDLARVFADPRAQVAKKANPSRKAKGVKEDAQTAEMPRAAIDAGASASASKTNAPCTNTEAHHESSTENMGRPVLEVKNLNVSFQTPNGYKDAIKDVSLAIEEDEIIGIVGESGSGKSVTMKAIMGLLPPGAQMSAEVIDLHGNTLLGLSEKDMRKVRGAGIAMVFQDPMTALNPLMKIGPQVVDVVLRHRKCSRKEAKKEAVELLRKVGIPSPEKRMRSYPHEFSGGMRQRVLIAMALACNPDLLVADEPTTALDVTTQAQILELIKEIHEKEHMPVVMISHDMGVMARMCDRIVVMLNGRIVEEGPTREIFENPSEPYTEMLVDTAREMSVRGSSAAGIQRNESAPAEESPSISPENAPTIEEDEDGQ